MSEIERTKDLYCRGLGLRVIGSFENHDGFDGMMLGVAGANYHFEFTHSRAHPVRTGTYGRRLGGFLHTS